jgi:hypothetical protein
MSVYASCQDRIKLIGKLYRVLGPLAGPGTGVVLLHDTEYKESDVDAEAGVYLKQSAHVEDPIFGRSSSHFHWRKYL